MLTHRQPCVRAGVVKGGVIFLIGIMLIAGTLWARQHRGEVRVVATPHAGTGGLYSPNRGPLQPTAFTKLPAGSMTPRGWLRHQLELMASGMSGRLPELSAFLKFEDNGWTNPRSRSGWEELPYWLKGYGDLGYALRDDAIIKNARKWIEAILAGQQKDGWFGPTALQTTLGGKPDMWPHMPVLNALQSYHEFTGDRRVIEFMTRYFRWQNRLPPSYFGAGYWPKMRFGDNIESIYWLYNRTGHRWLLDLAKKIHDNMADWTTDVPNWHNVNAAQCFREPAEFWLQSGERKHLHAAERNYQKIMDLYGQFPGGGFAGDEVCRPGYTDPRQGFETCGIVEFIHSFQMLERISGLPHWADRCEEIALNSLPAAMTPDCKGLHYITCANCIQLDRKAKGKSFDNNWPMLAYSPHQYRCCQHNHVMGWPYYAEELWLATSDRGLCASLYAASEVEAKVGDGTKIKIIEETDYPFSDVVQFKVALPGSVRFPLYLRVPGWCAKPGLKINGRDTAIDAPPLSYIVIERTWSDGDAVRLQLPMQLKVKTWTRNKNAVSVHYGPLTFSLQIREKWVRKGGNEAWPDFEVFPESPWNYGLEIDPGDPGKTIQVQRKAGALAYQPFTHENAPILLLARARKIPAWQKDRFGLVGLLQPSPVKSSEPQETVTLIPMGAARLRISAFPTIGHGLDAHEWQPPAQ
jgi:beta-L-arabinofuranosidase (glycosyl hydrolase family 127)/glycosyl hydrolase family 127 (putative beta-L-arabinofuranosidase)